MGRSRMKGREQWPKHVFEDNGRIVYRPDKKKTPIRLGKSDMDIADIWKAYSQLTISREDTLQFIADEYYKGEKFNELKSKKERKRTLQAILSSAALVHKAYSDINRASIRRYLDTNGHRAVAANREIAALSAAWHWCYERMYIDVPNPCKGVVRLTEHHRTRLVTASEYSAVYEIATLPIKVAMELAYLCRMRRSEVLDTRVKDILDDGLSTRRLKGSRDAITLWSDRLRAAVNLGLKGRLRVPEMPIVPGNIKPNQFSKMFAKYVKLAKVEPFVFHDLKAMGVSNSTDKQAAGGWVDASMVRVYDRSQLIVDATE